MPSLSLCPSHPHAVGIHILVHHSPDIPYQAHAISTAVISLCLWPHCAHARPISMPSPIPIPVPFSCPHHPQAPAIFISMPVIHILVRCPCPPHPQACHACPVHDNALSSPSLCALHAHIIPVHPFALLTSMALPSPFPCLPCAMPMPCPFCDKPIPMPSQSPHHAQTHVISAPVSFHHPSSFAHPMLISIPIPTPPKPMSCPQDSSPPHCSDSSATCMPSLPSCCACATPCPPRGHAACAHTSAPAPRSW